MTQIVDASGRSHTAAPDARILSLVPSLTETLFALGLANQIVGRTAFCIHPSDHVKEARSVGGTKQVNWNKVKAIAPTHAVLNIDENPKQMAEELEAMDIVPVVTHPIEPADNGPMIRMLGCMFGRSDEAEGMAQEFEAALASFPRAISDRNSYVLYLIWKDPWMTVSKDTYISRMLSLAGWRTLPDDATVRYPEVNLSGSLLKKADLVLFSSEPFQFTDKHLAEFGADHPDHVQKAHLIDGEMLSWYGARAIKGLAYLRSFVEEQSS